MTVRRSIVLSGATLLAMMLAPAATASPGVLAEGAIALVERGPAGPTELTFSIEGCDGCEIRLANAHRSQGGDAVLVWQSAKRTVRGGKVTFRIASRRTRGMSVAVQAPWEGHTGYVTTVAWRYNGEAIGDAVTVQDALTKRHAAPCWEGTRKRQVTIPLVVKEVEVAGTRERVPGSIAFVPTTRDWIGEMRPARHGVLGSQDVYICR